MCDFRCSCRLGVSGHAMNENQFQRALLDRLDAIAEALDSIRHELKKHEPPTVEVKAEEYVSERSDA